MWMCWEKSGDISHMSVCIIAARCQTEILEVLDCFSQWGIMGGMLVENHQGKFPFIQSWIRDSKNCDTFLPFTLRLVKVDRQRYHRSVFSGCLEKYYCKVVQFTSTLHPVVLIFTWLQCFLEYLRLVLSCTKNLNTFNVLTTSLRYL